MAKFLLSAMPFTGHVTPMIAVAAALAARGHDVRIYTGGAFAQRVRASGARFVPWTQAPDFNENNLSATFPRLVGRKGIRQIFANIGDLFIGTAPAQLADLDAEWAREPWDVLVGEESSCGPAFAAERLGVPWATIAIVPLTLPSRQGPPSGLGLEPGAGAIGRIRDRMLRAIAPQAMRPLRKPLAQARMTAGLAASALAFDRATYSPELILATGAPALDHDRTDRPPQLHWIGQLASPASGAKSVPPWWGDLDGSPVVHVTQGTQNIDPADLIRPTIDALAGRDVLVVVTTGVRGRDELPFAVPANVRLAGFIPHAQLLPRVSVMVTNGGWGGVLSALSHGIPLIVAGGDLDKPEVAARIASAGAGVNLRTGRPRAEKVAAAYERVSAEPSFRAAAERLRDELAALGGASAAAAHLERFAARETGLARYS